MIINIEWSLGYLDPVEVVHSEDGAPLVLKADEAEALGFACLFVPNQVDINYLSVPEWEKKRSTYIIAHSLSLKGKDIFLLRNRFLGFL